MGAGVAGLQAIATARRLGAVVTATDVRAAAGEQVESLGAKFIMTDALKDASGTGGYARELTDTEKARLALDADEPTAIAAIEEMSAAVQATEDFAEGIASFLERRPAVFRGR